MEKLINILPNLITNENSDWINNVLNPDKLTVEVMKHYDKPINVIASTYIRYLKGKDIRNPLQVLKGVTDKSSVKELIPAVKESEFLPHGKELAALIEELDKKYNLEGKSATAVLWIANVVNGLEKRGIDQDTLIRAFAYVCSTSDREKRVSDLHKEIREVLNNDEEIAKDVDDYLRLAFVTNPIVQDPSNWYEFSTLDAQPMIPTMEIKRDRDLFVALKDINNYNAALDYIKQQYLSEKQDVTSDSYCIDENERDYKAFIILATLASELYKDDPEFDKDNNIGLNIATEILVFQREYNKKHILSPLTNGLNHYEDAAGRICEKILGRKLVQTKTTVNTSYTQKQNTFKYGDMQKYIMAKLDTFKLFVEPSIKYYEGMLKDLQSIAAKYDDKNFRGRKTVMETLALISREVGVALVSGNGKDVNLRENVELLTKAVTERLGLLLGLQRVFDKVKKVNKANLDIKDFTKGLGSEIALVALRPETIDIIRQFYLVVADDPLLKGDPAQVLRIKSSKQLAADIKAQTKKNPDKTPEIVKLTRPFTLAPREAQVKLATDKYAPVDKKDVNKDYEDLYKAMKAPNSKVSVEEKREAVEKADLTQEEKDELLDLLK